MVRNFCFSVLTLLCLSACNAHEQQPSANLPPKELLFSNIQIAENVILFKLADIVAVDTLLSDAGHPGYIRYQYSGEVVQCLKCDTPADSLTKFFSVAEYNPSYLQYWKNKKQIYVFLNRNQTDQQFNAIEAGIFAYSKNLQMRMDSLLYSGGNSSNIR